jgi:hypothetical protein
MVWQTLHPYVSETEAGHAGRDPPRWEGGGVGGELRAARTRAVTVPALLELAVVVVAAHRRDAVLTALPPRHPLGRLLTAREAVAGSWRGEEQHPTHRGRPRHRPPALSAARTLRPTRRRNTPGGLTAHSSLTLCNSRRNDVRGTGAAQGGMAAMVRRVQSRYQAASAPAMWISPGVRRRRHRHR